MANAYSEAVRQALSMRREGRAYPRPNVDQPSSIIRQNFTVANETANLQMLAWSDYVGRILDVPVSRKQVAAGFRGELDTYVLKDMIYLDSRTDPVSQARTLARISNDSMRDYVFHIVVEGIAETVTGSFLQRKSAQFVPGILALDMNQAMRMERPTRARVLAFFLPRPIVEAAIPQAESIHGQVIAYTSPLTHLLREHLIALYRELPTMDEVDAENNLRICAQLILAAFGRQARLSDSARVAARAAMLGRVKHYIHANLHQEELSPDKILSAFPLARPTLYRMFEHEGGLSAYIRNCRLREAADELARSTRLTITQIASRWGFSYASDFTRAFRRAYGVAPQEFRSLGLEWMGG
ncbi:helix-turn-helix domain-containing protein [Dyella silvatica]|uniref:helix-turn-helix domain-containing protein n=1 Tax=Dyella silvatica TaxID=2992128 RepID=UPI0022572B6A|nr:helix-turn-helix domain-containing protein [Dyella silvatica]